MHVALALFLSGLMLFLKDLNDTLFKAVIAIPAATLFFYLVTALLPLAVSFCPYNTPLFRTIGSILYWACYDFWSHSPGTNHLTLPCQMREKSYSEQTTPDKLTAQAIKWLIMHSPDDGSIDSAITALSGSTMYTNVWKYLSQESLVAFVAQKFTSLFQIMDPSTGQLQLQALANLVRQLNSNPIIVASMPDGVVTSSKMTLTKEHVTVVERGLSLLAFGNDKSNEVKASAIMSLSAWYTSMTREGQNREEWRSIIEELVKLLSASPNNSISTPNPSISITPATASYNSPRPAVADPDMISHLGQTLAVEISYWRWDLSGEETKDLLKSVISVFSRDLGLLRGPAWKGLSATLAVLSLMFNDYVDISPKESQTKSKNVARNVEHASATVDKFQLAALYEQSEEEFKRSYKHLGEQQKRKILQRVWRARWIARAGTVNPKFLDKYSETLLLLGLPGVLQSLVEFGLEDLASSFAGVMRTKLSRLPFMKQQQLVALPYIFPATFDIRSKAIDIILDCLNLLCTRDSFSPPAQAALLGCLIGEMNTWKRYGLRILEVAAKLLPSNGALELQEQCMVALEEYWLVHSNRLQPQSTPRVYRNPTNWRFFFDFGIPRKLVCIYRDRPTLRSRAISIFHSIMHAIPVDDTIRRETKVESSKVLNQLVVDSDGDLAFQIFGMLAGKFLNNSACAHKSPCEQSTWWKDQITQWTTWFPDQHTLTTGGQYSLEIIRALCIDYKRTQDFNRFTHLLEARM